VLERGLLEKGVVKREVAGVGRSDLFDGQTRNAGRTEACVVLKLERRLNND
jgi:hypothetical protein